MARVGRWVAIAGGCVAAGCVDKPMPTQNTVLDNSHSLRASFILRLGRAAQTVAVKVGYLRATGERVPIAEDTVSLEAGARDIRLSADLTACLADQARSGPRESCPVVVSLLIRDTNGAGIDSVGVGPFAAVPGSVSVPFAVGASLADTVVVESGDTVRVASGASAGRDVIYSSSDTSVVAVSSAGLLTARAIGLATVTASSGISATATRVQVSPHPADALALGDIVSCALTATGAAHCWGILPGGAVSTVPVQVGGALRFKQIAVWGSFGAPPSSTICAVTASGTVYCWGTGLRVNDTTAAVRTTPTPIPSTVPFRTVAMAGNSTCALSNAGAVYCWGVNRSGVLGTGDTVSKFSPALVSGTATFSAISAGLSWVCGLSTGGAALCWGANSFGTLGSGVPIAAFVPTPVAGAPVFQSLRAGGPAACGITATGTAYCWGTNLYGALGHGLVASPTVPTPTAVVGGVTFRHVAPGSGNNVFAVSCGVAVDGTGYCWGANRSGQLGTTSALPNSCTFSTFTFGCTGTPTAVSTNSKFKIIVAGAEQTCGITTTHALMCWGDNTSGQVGDGTTTSRSTPVPVSGGLRMP